MCNSRRPWVRRPACTAGESTPQWKNPVGEATGDEIDASELEPTSRCVLAGCIARGGWGPAVAARYSISLVLVAHMRAAGWCPAEHSDGLKVQLTHSAPHGPIDALRR